MKRRQSYEACSIESCRGRLQLRFRLVEESGRVVHVARATGYEDTPEARGKLAALREVVGQLVRAGRDPRPHLDELLRRRSATAAPPSVADAQDAAQSDSSPTLASYFERWIVAREPHERPANARDYRRHHRLYIAPVLGVVPLAQIDPQAIRGLQGELLRRVSAKTAKNVIGSFRAVLATAIEDRLVSSDVLPRLKWPDHETPDPDPLTSEERGRILEWFAIKTYGFPHEKGSWSKPKRLHPPFHAYVHLLFWTGMRPSEASGLQWRDVDLAGARLHVRRSYHTGVFNKAPKTKKAKRTVWLYPATVKLLRSIEPLHHEPTTPVFIGTTGAPIEPKTFSAHWYDCLRALGIRQRGIYCMKDTYVTSALKAGVRIERLEAQTGVAYAMLREHYATWVLDDESRDELSVLAESDDPSLLGSAPPRRLAANRRRRA
jgi:integrase